MSTSSDSRKLCVSCGKDVTSAKRMKDSEGRYWCVDCGEADLQRKRLAGISAGGGACDVCGDQYPAGKLTQFGDQRLCASCILTRNKKPGLIGRIKQIFGGAGKA